MFRFLLCDVLLVISIQLFCLIANVIIVIHQELVLTCFKMFIIICVAFEICYNSSNFCCTETTFAFACLLSLLSVIDRERRCLSGGLVQCSPFTCPHEL